MKKRYILLLFALTIALYQLAAVNGQSSAGVGLTVRDTVGPGITLLGLINNSGFFSGNVSFPYNATDDTGIGNCSVIFNGKFNATNQSVEKGSRSEFKLFELPVGRFNFSINCTDSLNFSSVTAAFTFTVNKMASFNGSTTNISTIDLRNITNFVTEVTASGRVNFSEGIDLSEGFDLEQFINISSNFIGLDADALPQLNKSATLYIYNLAFTDPRVLRNGEVCPSTICAEVPPYSGGLFIFNVTQFSNYSGGETPKGSGEEAAPSAAAGGGGGGTGGGGGPVRLLRQDFELGATSLKVVLKQGQSSEEAVSIRNTGEAAIGITTYLQALRNFIASPILDEISITLNPNQEEMINLVFAAAEDQTPDIYTGEILLKSSAVERIINTIIEVESVKPLFDVDAEVRPEYKSILPGERIFMEVSLFNVRGFGRVDVNLEYTIRDFQGSLIASEEETVAVETQAKFVRELLVPSDIKPGLYVASAKVTFEDSVGISSDVFEVRAKEIRLYRIPIKDYQLQIAIAAAVLAAIAASFLVYRFYAPRKHYAPKTKEEAGRLLKTEVKINKLQKELKALESAYKSKFISEQSYMGDKERIEKEIMKLSK